MSDPPVNGFVAKFRLRTVLIVPFVLQVLAVVGLISYLYWRNEQKAIDDIATRSGQEIAVRVEQNLRSYLAIPHLVNQNNAAAIELGQLNLQNLPGLEQYFWRQLQVFETLTFAGIGFENRDNLGAERNDDGSLVLRVSTRASGYDFGTYSTNQSGDRLRLLHHKPNFDPRTRPWYEAAVAARQPVWSEIYPNTAGLTAYLGASQPFYDRQGNLQGVLLTNISLSQIGNFLQSLRIGNTGQAFIIERSGLLVATSTGEKPFRTVQKEFGAERVKATDSRNPLTRATTQHLIKNFTANGRINIQQSELLEFDVNGRRKFLQVLPFRDRFGLDWLIVVVVPESDFTGRIATSTRSTSQFALVALVVALACGILTARWITNPILQVSRASEAIARGDLGQHVAPSSLIEIETLSNAFNSMATQLQTSFTALKQSETENRAIVEALPDLLFRARGDGTYLDNPIGRNRLRAVFAGDRSLKGVNIYNSLPFHLAYERMHAIERALQTGELQVYEQQLVINHQAIDEEVRVVKVADDEVLVMVRDITERKRAEAERRQAEENLRIAEENYRSIFENALEGIFQSTPEGRFISVNPAMARIYGYLSPEAMLADITDIGQQTFVDPARREEFKRLLNEQAQVKDFEYQIYQKDRRIVWIEENTRVVKGAEGRILYYEGIIQDITDRKQQKEILEARVEERTTELAKANAALKTSEAELQGLFAAMDDVIIVRDRQGLCLKVASTNPDLLLKSPDEMVGRTVHDLLPPDQAELLLAAIQQVLDTHQTTTIEYSLLLGENAASSNKREVWFSANLSPLSENTVIIVARDITARKQVERALQASEAELRALFAAMTDVVIIKDRHGHYLKIAPTNPSNLLTPASGLSGLTEYDLLPKAQADRFVSHIQQVLETQQMMSIDYCLTIANRDVWFTANVSPLTADTVVWVARDISERKRVEDERKQAEKALQESELKYRNIFENSRVGIGRTRLGDGLILDANQQLAEIFGFNAATELIGQRSICEFYLSPDDARAVMAALEQQGELRDYELQVRRHDDSKLWIVFSLKHNLETFCAEFVIADISDRKQAEAALQNSLTQLAIANQEIKLLNQRLESENLRLSAELAVARRLQQMILPKDEEFSQIDGLEIAGFMEPADEVGGDYYDVIQHNGSVKISIGDVTGHGLESGVLMMMVQTAVRTLLANHETEPRRFLSTINQVIYDNAQRINSNKNLSLTLLDYRDGKVRLSGQHEDVLVVRANQQIERIDTTDLGFLLGLLPDISEFIAQAEVQLQPGDGIVLYTDGITEAENEAKEHYSLERLCEVIAANWEQSAAAIRQAVVEDVWAHVGQQKLYDDITLLVLKQKS